MTKTKLFGILAVSAITVGGIAIVPHIKGITDTPESKIEAIGLPNHGLEVIDPRHPAFSRLLAGKKSGPGNPFSVFVVNNSNQAVASCTLKYEIVLRDGRTVTHFKTKTSTLETVLDDGTAHLEDGIAAKGNLLFSLTDSPSSDNQHVNFSSGGGDPNIASQLSESVKVRVSIDGVLFVDGTYIGPDTNNYFELFRGQIEASRELDTEIAQLINDGAKPKVIMNHLAKVANTQSSEIQCPPGEDPKYSFGKWMKKRSYAGLLLLMGKRKEHQAVLERIHSELSKPEIKLRKLKES